MFTSDNYYNTEDLSAERITVDTPEDFELVRKVIEVLGIDRPYMDYINFLKEQKSIRAMYLGCSRNEWYEISIMNDVKIKK